MIGGSEEGASGDDATCRSALIRPALMIHVIRG